MYYFHRILICDNFVSSIYRYGVYELYRFINKLAKRICHDNNEIFIDTLFYAIMEILSNTKRHVGKKYI